MSSLLAALVFAIGLISAGVLTSPLATAARIGKVDFPEGESCVAWKTKKTFAFVRTITVVGKNCQISAEVIPEPDDHFHLEISIPIAGFESGEAERDREVATMLKADVSKEMEFVSDSIKIDNWKGMISAGEFDLKGELKIGKKNHKIKIEISRTKQPAVFVGKHKSKFKKFDIKPPELLAGIGARVSEELELLFQLNTDEVLGAQSILGNDDSDSEESI
jgi:polyisoprenoid-binding protein YceI